MPCRSGREVGSSMSKPCEVLAIDAMLEGNVGR